MKKISARHIFGLVASIKPIMNLIFGEDAPKDLGTNVFIKEQVDENGKTHFYVICTVKFSTLAEAEQFKKIDEELDKLTVKFSG